MYMDESESQAKPPAHVSPQHVDGWDDCGHQTCLRGVTAAHNMAPGKQAAYHPGYTETAV